MQVLDTSEILRSLFCSLGKNWLALIALVVSGTALIITWIKNVRDRKRADDKELLEQLKLSLEQAYGAITLQNGNGHLPRKDRSGWLAAARHLVRYWELKKSLKTQLYNTICDEQEEFWRHQFYLLLRKISDSSFFVWINPEEMQEETIEPKSAGIIYAFSQWREGLPDPLESWSLEQIVVKYKLFSPLNRHFREFIEGKFPKLAERAKGNP